MTAAGSADRNDALLAAAALFLALATVWARPEPPLFLGGDTAAYARVAREAAERPLSRIAEQTLGGVPFYEHPPLAFSLEGLWLRALGPTAASVRSFARVLASLLVLLVFGVARTMAGPRAGALSVLALPVLPGFLFESQNAMLELPLAVTLALAVSGAIRLVRDPVGGSLLFAAGFAGAALTKGPPAAAAFLFLGWSAVRLRAPRRRVLAAGCLALASLLVAVACFEAARRAEGLEPFFPAYLRAQVLPAFQSHWRADIAPFFFVRPLTRWYLAGLLALPVAAVFLVTRVDGDANRRLIELGLVCALVIVVGFLLPPKRAAWYFHPAVFGFAWLIGGSAATVPRTRADLGLAGAAAVVGLVFVLGLSDRFTFGRRRVRGELVAIHELPPPWFPPGTSRTVAHCGQLGDWHADNTFQFLWRAHAVPCGEPASLVFDGQELRPRAPESR